MQLSKQLDLVVIGLGVGLVLLYTAKQAATQTAKALDDWSQESTQGAGQALSDLFARVNGWEPVELTPLLIRDFYLKDDFTLTDEARRVLWSIDQYKPLLIELFGTEYSPLKAQYRALINVNITKESL